MSKPTSKELKSFLNLIEEFSWVTEKFSKIDKNKLKEIINGSEDVDDKGYLIGYLPRILLDKELFLKNKDISDFAVLLGVDINPKSNRSRNEMIGTIVCEIQEGINVDTKKVYKIIESLVDNDSLLNKIKIDKKNSGGEYDWNVVIRNIYNKG